MEPDLACGTQSDQFSHLILDLNDLIAFGTQTRTRIRATKID